ncbi:TRAP transporter substrate-binding protein DctP [Alkalihalobacillus sp. LMS39]|uniref:TRAP transporter substrate-binding protein DctP n=1 Tax=Alkalihalobacillus sp. LMS39 TaxID=2924032 RepID=UPI001FB2925C|nr:TRAP transporter substrate-binding protein DctP [Alkalihalobacillus sp. LMS39]UOE94893.1 TRAP transporter substrate-binding protein DctP [Alkalihalobacillus sp. LMS39]
MKKSCGKLFGIGILAVSLLAACGSSESGGNTTEPTETESQTEIVENSGETITIKIGHIAPPGHPYTIALEEMTADITEETNEQVKFEIFGNGQLGGERDLAEQVQLGSLDMSLLTSGPVANFVPEVAVLDLPFLFRDLNHVYETLDGEVGEELLTAIDSNGFKGLGLWENGMRHFTNNKKEIKTPEDLNGLQMRTLESDIFLETYRALGADPTPIAFTELYTSFQQGVVDGTDTSYGVAESTNIYEVQAHLSEVGMYYAAALLVLNKDKFESLPTDIQELFVQKGEEYKSFQRNLTQEMEAEQKETLLEAGVTIVEADEIDIDAFRSAVEPVYDKFNDQFGSFIEKIRASE